MQHAGLALDTRLSLMATDDKRAVAHPGPFLVRSSVHAHVGSAMTVNREVSGLTAACVAMTREVYYEVGGMSEVFAGNFGDVDLSLKVGRAGYRRLWIATAAAYHFEAQTRRQAMVKPHEVRKLSQRWSLPRHDPYQPGDIDFLISTGRLRGRRARQRVRYQ